MAIIPMPTTEGTFDCEANARLIVVAPELLDALKRAREELRLIRMKDCDRVYDVTLRLAMDLVIAKGGSEPK